MAQQFKIRKMRFGNPVPHKNYQVSNFSMVGVYSAVGVLLQLQAGLTSRSWILACAVNVYRCSLLPSMGLLTWGNKRLTLNENSSLSRLQKSRSKRSRVGRLELNTSFQWKLYLLCLWRISEVKLGNFLWSNPASSSVWILRGVASEGVRGCPLARDPNKIPLGVSKGGGGLRWDKEDLQGL